MSIARSVVLPAYNESGYIQEMIRRCISAMERRDDTFEVIVIDNCSTDDTAEKVREMAAMDGRVRLIQHDTNKLYAGSCLTGAKESQGDRVFILDSDGQIDPESIWAFDKGLDDGNDIVFGRRVDRGDAWHRIAISRVFWLHARLLISYELSDVNTGIRGMTRQFANALELKYRINLANPEMFVRAKLGGFRAGEVEVRQHERQAGVSSHQFAKLWDIEKTVVSHLLDLRRELKAGKKAAKPAPAAARQR